MFLSSHWNLTHDTHLTDRSGVESRIRTDWRFDGYWTNWGLSLELCSAVTNLEEFNTWLTLESVRKRIGIRSLIWTCFWVFPVYWPWIFCLLFFKRIQLYLLRILATDSMLPTSLLPSNRSLFTWTPMTFNLAQVGAGNSGKSPWTWMRNNVFSFASHKIGSPSKPLVL